MLIGKAIVAILTADSTVNQQISGRVSDLRAPEANRASSYPMVVYGSEGSENEKTNDGKSGMVRQTVRVSCLAQTTDAVEALLTAVNSALLGAPGRSTYGGVFVHGIFAAGEDADVVSADGIGPDVLIYIKSLILTIWFNLS